MNAIIIAAGTGSRLRPLTYDIPKSLINVLGKPMLEKNIEYLIESNIKEIVIVVGYLKEKYKEVILIFNDKFYEYNNIYSFYLIREYLEDSYILDGDIFITENIFNNSLKDSRYLAKKLKEIMNGS
ncbi:sugar phosphate nucleotidyltransferase [Fusobacterium sp. THCT1E2]